ncbi:MAG: alpha/beta hydrolase, partial [Planctomycetota bacterium]|nr:alpha/beta hydrolase [Planctomycetota bacterium]
MRNQLHFALFGMAMACIASVPDCPAADIQILSAEAGETAEDVTEALPDGINVPAKTLGGNQLWADELVFHDWRIQRNSLTGHYRLLDDKDVRQKWGSWDQCAQALEDERQERGLPPLKGRVVLLVHGLGRTRHSMDSMRTHLREHGHYEAMTISYPSMRQEIVEHAAGLKRVIDHLGPEVFEINFVAHSLGNLVIRQYLHDLQKENLNGRIDSRIGRVVMLAPPNQDACITRLFRSEKMFQFVVKGTGEQLSEQLPKL